MAEPNETTPATVPEQPESKPPLKKTTPLVIAVLVVLGLLLISSLSNLVSGNKRSAPQSSLTMSPTTPNAQQVSSFETQQQQQARKDAEERQRQQDLAAAMQQLQQDQGVPGPEAAGSPPMTPAQRAAIYGESPNAPQHTSNVSEGTRLIGSVQSVGNAQQRKMFVTFHRAVCPDGFSLDFDKYLGLDQIGTTGLATKVDHGYLLAFGAAAAIGGLGGLAQIGNNGSVFTPSTEIRNGISEQSAAEGEQVLNHFLNRLPIITLKEGSRARVYIGRDILIPSYAEHRVDPTL